MDEVVCKGVVKVAERLIGGASPAIQGNIDLTRARREIGGTGAFMALERQAQRPLEVSTSVKGVNVPEHSNGPSALAKFMVQGCEKRTDTETHQDGSRSIYNVSGDRFQYERSVTHERPDGTKHSSHTQDLVDGDW